MRYPRDNQERSFVTTPYLFLFLLFFLHEEAMTPIPLLTSVFTRASDAGLETLIKRFFACLFLFRLPTVNPPLPSRVFPSNRFLARVFSYFFFSPGRPQSCFLQFPAFLHFEARGILNQGPSLPRSPGGFFFVLLPFFPLAAPYPGPRTFPVPVSNPRYFFLRPIFP